MTHRMILVSHDFKEVKAMMTAKRKEDKDRRDSLAGKISDSYPEVGGPIPPPGSTSTEET